MQINHPSSEMSNSKAESRAAPSSDSLRRIPALAPHPPVARKSLALTVRQPILALLDGPARSGAASRVACESSVRRWGLPLGFALIGLAILPIDLPISHWFLDHNCPDSLDKLLSLSESFAHGLGAALILATAFILDPATRSAIPRMGIASLGAGLFANLGKLVLSRTRPDHFSFHGTVWDTFGKWFPLTSAGSGGQGFPSAHAATAAGLALALAWRYPRGRMWFFFLAALSTMQRVSAGDHFPSDALWGVAVGLFVALGVLPGGLLSPFFGRLERSLAGHRG